MACGIAAVPFHALGPGALRAERAAAARVACVVDWQRKVAATVGQRYARGWLARRARGELYTTAGARTAAAQSSSDVEPPESHRSPYQPSSMWM